MKKLAALPADQLSVLVNSDRLLTKKSLKSAGIKFKK